MSGREVTLYVYALTEPGMPRRLPVRGHSLHVISLGPADVVVERRRDRPDASAEALQDQHAVVLHLASRCDALLPARFGSLIEEGALRTTLTGHDAEIVDALNLVRGRQQMTIRVFGAPDDGGPAADRSTGTAFLQSRKERAHYVPPEVTTIRTELGPVAAAERLESGEGGLRVTMFHLVARNRVAAYRRRASALQQALTPHRVTVTGPWPAFAFTPVLF
jgi:hypothetical protein